MRPDRRGGGAHRIAWDHVIRRCSQLSYFAANDWGRPSAAAGSVCVTPAIFRASTSPRPGSCRTGQGKASSKHTDRRLKEILEARPAAYSGMPHKLIARGNGSP